MRKILISAIIVILTFSALILPQNANGVPSKSPESQVGCVRNGFVVKFSSDFEDINPKAEKWIVLTGIWELDALNQYFRVDLMEPVSPWKILQSELPEKSRYYLLKCHPLSSLDVVMDTYLSLPFVDNVELLDNNSKFFFYPENQKSKSAEDKSNNSVMKPSADIPCEFSISQNFPNPFNAQTSFSISLPDETHVNVVVYNVMGQKVKILVDEGLTAGIHTITWDGTNESNQNVSSGIYFYRIVTQENVVTRKMTLIK
ncbi:MAG: T9SS type A sorting domain-containing protein [Candidatus Zixiibacteriota bacterium]